MYPTPIVKMNYSDGKNNFYIKRDDLHPISFGGNKARKAVLFFEDIIAKNADSVITYGSSSSNHCRVIANIAASYRLPCYIITPEENRYETSNSRIVNIFGATLIYCSINNVKQTIDETLNKLVKQGYNPYFIEGGGHGNIGTQAYVDAYNEIINYEKSQKIYFDYIFHTSGTGTTQAGLICGKLINKDDRKIIGISNARKNPYGSNVVLKSVNDYLISKKIEPIESNEVLFIDDYVLNGYGDYNSFIIDTIREVLISDGIPLDTTYTGKAFWGMKEYVKKYNLINKNILFIHTGGTPLFFDKLEEL